MQQLSTAEDRPSSSCGPAPARAPAERKRALDVITLGFAADPIARWFWPKDADYLHWMPQFVEAFSGPALGHGTADLTPCGRAAAFWLPCGVHSDEEALGRIIEESIPVQRRAEIESFVAQMEEHHPDGPCWHLPQIAVEPAAQGQGLGSALLACGLERCDADRADVYLESSNLRNVPLYERFGFEVTGEIQAGSSPVMYPMLRRSR